MKHILIKLLPVIFLSLTLHTLAQDTYKEVIAFQFDDANGFSNGLAGVKKGNKWGYIDKTGKIVINYQFDKADYFCNDLARVKIKDNVFYIDKTGKTVRKEMWHLVDRNGNQEKIVDFDLEPNGFVKSGIDCENKENKWGYVDKIGNVVIDYQFEDAKNFSSNCLAAVRKEKMWGYIELTSPTNYITKYIKTEKDKWQQKGKFETTAAYNERVNEINWKVKFEEFSTIAIQNIAPIYCDWETITTVYDADNLTFKINIKGISPFYLKVPLSEAVSFDATFKKLLFSKIMYALGPDGEFFLQKAIILNPDNKKSYKYFSTDKAVFTEYEPWQPNKPDYNPLVVGIPDVDVNIPINLQTNDKTFVVIIANENYQKEVKVQFASNDGKVFREYCEKTIGIPSKNIHFTQDASFGNMKSEIKWLSDISAAFNGQAKIIFYYAGHGMPNEGDKSAYLLPIDGFSSDFETAIKLDDLFNRLNATPSLNTMIFLDACFSGSVRDNGMLASARGVKVKPKTNMMKGKIIVFSASTGDETAYPYKEKQHGLFTYFLLKKLQETKGNVDFQNLSNYIIENVKQQSILVNQKNQTPQINVSPEIQNIWQQMKIK